MNERKYWGFHTRSTPDAIKQRIARLIEQNNLRERIPHMYCEKPSARRGVREFYFFLNIIADDNDVPYDILRHPDLKTIASPVEEKPLTYDEFKSMAGPEVEFEAIKYGRQLVYRPPETAKPENPFDFAVTTDSDFTSSEAYRRLLYWMSAVGRGTWQGFREACRTLGLSEIAEARHIFRRLRLLGHVEYLNSGMHWEVCPPCLVKVNAQHDWRYFLSGAQVPTLIDKLRNVAPVEIRDNHGGPTSVFVMFDSESNAQERVASLQENYRQLRYAGTAGERLAAILPDLDSWCHTVLTEISVASDRFKLEKWNGRDFEISGEPSTETGMYRLSDLVNPESDICYYYYFDADRNCWFQGDWYGLRFLANHHLGIQAEFTYKLELRQLYAPSAAHIPDLYERSLVLASGKLPSPADGGLVYENINEALAKTLCSKLYAQLTKGV
ncbi:MAG: hypothetical protein DYG88_11435 [Chloroflexi bacterium CFX4]|nr:hypothetical protein [Chloroflexi bacterium CFX4]MDL1922987.1 hypothetical protein [Chloroflexi bacterium CFX3]